MNMHACHGMTKVSSEKCHARLPVGPRKIKIDKRNACTINGSGAGDKRESKVWWWWSLSRANHVILIIILKDLYIFYIICERQLHVIHAPSSTCCLITTRPRHSLAFTTRLALLAKQVASSKYHLFFSYSRRVLFLLEEVGSLKKKSRKRRVPLCQHKLPTSQ